MARRTSSFAFPLPSQSSTSFMATSPYLSFLLPTAVPTLSCTLPHNTLQRRHATLLRRPKRPYTFTQLVTLSDGSTYTHRTTSPQAVYISQKDARNTPLWNPSNEKLTQVEADEAGKLKKFRAKFGKGFDIGVESQFDETVPDLGRPESEIAMTGQDKSVEAETVHGQTGGDAASGKQQEDGQDEDEEEDSLMDLITGTQKKKKKNRTAAPAADHATPTRSRSGSPGKGGKK